MKWSAVILLVGLVMTSDARAQCTPHFLANDPVCDLGDSSGPAPDTFLNLVCTMQTDYDTSKFSPISTPNDQYTSPNCVGAAKDVSKQYLDLLGSAFTLAPDDVKKKFCKLKHLFITTTAQGTLGIWEAPGRGSPGGQIYLAVTEDALKSALTTKSLAAEELDIFKQLVNPSQGSPNFPQLPTFQDTSDLAKKPEAAILAILSHELGHVLLADTNADGTGGHGQSHPRSDPDICGPVPSRRRCFETAFLGTDMEQKRWSSIQFHTKGMRRWIQFGDIHSNKHQNQNLMSLKRIQELVKTGNYVGATTGIYGVYANGEFVSLFADASPEEDLIETYKYKILAMTKSNNATLDLNITFPSGGYSPINLLDRVRNVDPNSDLGGKIDCLRSLQLP
jgi:hypothetical protein